MKKGFLRVLYAAILAAAILCVFALSLTASAQTVEDKVGGANYTDILSSSAVSGPITITRSGEGNDRWTVKVGSNVLCDRVLTTNANGLFDNAKVLYSSIEAGIVNAKARRNEGPGVSTVYSAYNVVSVNCADQTSTAYDTDGDGDIDCIVVNPAYYDEVVGVPTSAIMTAYYSFDAGNGSSVVYEAGLNDGDLVKILPDYETGAIKIEKLTEKVVGVVSDTAGAYNEKFVIDGKAYGVFTYSSVLENNPNRLYKYTNSVLNNSGQTVIAYTDGISILFAESFEEPLSSVLSRFVYVIDAYYADAEGHSNSSIMIKGLFADGSIKTVEFDTGASATEYLQTADLGDLMTGNVDDVNVAGKVYEYATDSDGKIRLRKTPKETVDVDFTVVSNARFDYDRQTIGAYAIDDSTYAFVKYYEKKGDTEPSYKVVKATEFKNGMDYQRLTVYAHSTAKGTISAALITVYDATVENAYDGGVFPRMTDTKVVIITDKMYHRAYDAEDEETKNYIRGIDVKTGATETYVIANTNPMDMIYTEYDPERMRDLTGSFFELEPDGDEYVFTYVYDSWGWVIDSVQGVSSNAIQLRGRGLIFSSDDEVKNAKVYVRNGKARVSESTFSAITAAKYNAANIMLHYDGADIDIIIYSSNPSRDVNGWWEGDMADGGAALVLSDAKITAGGSAEVNVLVSNYSPFAYLELAPVFPSEFVLKSVENSGLITSFAQNGNYIWSSEKNMPDSGKLLTLTFDIPKSVKPGEYTVSFNGVACKDQNGENTDLKVTAGTVKVYATLTDLNDPDLNYVTTTVLANENWAIDNCAPTAEGKTRFADPIAAAEDDIAVQDDLVGKEVVVGYTVKNGKTVIIGAAETGNSVAGAITITRSGYENNKWTVKVGDKVLCDRVIEAKANEVFDNAQVVFSSVEWGMTISEAIRNYGSSVYTVRSAYDLVAVNSADQTSTAYDKDGDGDIDYIVVNPAYYDQVVGDPSGTYFCTAYYSFDIDYNYDSKVKYEFGLQDDDYVKILPDYASGEIRIEKLTEKVVGVVSATAGDYNEKYVIDGKAYETFSYSSVLYNNPNRLYEDTDSVLYNLGQSVTAYTDGTYIIFAEAAREEPATVTGKFAYIIDAYYADYAYYGSSIMIKALFEDGSVKTMEFDTGASSKDYLQAADLGDLNSYYLEDIYVYGKVYEYAVNSEGKIRLRKAPKQTTDVDFTVVADAAFDYDRQTIGVYVIDDSTYAFVKYYEKKGDVDPSYKVVKATDFKNGMDGQRLTVYAHSTAKGKISAAIITVYDATVENAYDGGLLPGTTDTKVVMITDKMYYRAYDAEDKETKNYIRGIDIKTGASGTYVIANTNYNDKIFQETTYTSDLRSTFFELEPDGDEYFFTPAADAGWVIDSVTGVSSRAIQLMGQGVIDSADDIVNNAKVYVRDGNTCVFESTFSAITAAKNDAKNIMLHYDGADIDVIIYSSNASGDVNGGYWYGDTSSSDLETAWISVKTLPAKTEWNVGQTPDFTGLTLTAHRNDGSEKTVTDGFTVSSVSTVFTGVKTLTVAYEDKTDKFAINVTQRIVTGISVKTMPTNTSYYVNDTPDYTGLTLKVTYDKGDPEIISSGFTTSPVSTAEAGTKTVTVTYEGASTSFNITVIEPKVTAIAIKSLPNTEWFIGETPDYTGLTLTVSYDNGRSAEITSGFTTSNVSTAAAGTKTVTVTYKGKTASFKITVSAIILTEIRVSTLPDKVEWFIGQTPDYTGLTITAVYNNGAAETVTSGFTASSVSTDTAGTKTVTITYNGKTTSFEIIVVAPSVTSVAVKTLPAKTEWFTTQTPDYTGLTLTAYYNDGSETTVAEGFTTSEITDVTAGVKTVTVAYEGKTASFEITLVSPSVTNVTVKTLPLKTEWFTTQTPDFTGLTLTAFYNDGSEKTVTEGFTVSEITDVTAGTKTVTVTFEGKTATFDILLTAPTITSLTLKTLPSKTEWYVGDVPDYTGLALTASYNDGNDKTVTDGFTVSNVNNTMAGVKKVFVTYEGMTVSFNITFIDKLITSGTCGNGLSWTLYGDGTLTIYGEGKMADQTSGGAPWYGYKDAIKKAVIKNGVTYIGNYAFSECSALTSVTIPDSVTAIGERAFRSCSALTSVNLSDNVTEIGKWAFSGCSAITNLIIPQSVSSVSTGAFSACSSIKNVSFGANVKSIGNYAFSDCSGITDVYYGGTTSQWETLQIGSNNDKLVGASVHFEAAPKESYPEFDAESAAVSDQYKDIYDVTVTQTDDAVTVHVTELAEADAQNDLSVLCISYDRNGKMTAARTAAVQKTAEGADFTAKTSGSSCKLFILDGFSAPVIKALESK